MFKGILIIFAFLLFGEITNVVFDLLVPGNILGMVFIFLALKFGVLKLELVKPISDRLLQFLPLFFIPYGVGLLPCKDLLQEHGLVILSITFVSTLLTLIVTGFVQQKLTQRNG